MICFAAPKGEYKTDEAKKMVAVGYANIALCYLKFKRFSEAKEAVSLTTDWNACGKISISNSIFVCSLFSVTLH